MTAYKNHINRKNEHRKVMNLPQIVHTLDAIDCCEAIKADELAFPTEKCARPVSNQHVPTERHKKRTRRCPRTPDVRDEADRFKASAHTTGFA